MSYIREESKVIYKSKDGTNTSQFDAVNFIASLASHISNMGEQTVRYFGYYSNVCRGKRKKQNCDGLNYLGLLPVNLLQIFYF
ncbi:MAG: transposase [Actinobacteria bacterium]|nr:transposase [Actinomycetota bacterium]